MYQPGDKNSFMKSQWLEQAASIIDTSKKKFTCYMDIRYLRFSLTLPLRKCYFETIKKFSVEEGVARPS